MRIPLTPPLLEDVLRIEGAANEPVVYSVLAQARVGPEDAKGRYLHWDKFRHLVPPVGMSPDLYWLAVRNSRTAISTNTPFLDVSGQSLSFGVPNSVLGLVSWIDREAAMQVGNVSPLGSAKDSYLITSQIEESITSSQLEGAATTRRVADDMIRSGRKPRDLSETMIYNHHSALVFIKGMKDLPLTPSMIFELHKILTKGTFEEVDVDKAGVFRAPEDNICVHSGDEIVHTPPRANELAERLRLVCDFANSADEINEAGFIPPVIRAIIVHFMIGYDHPFVDGNGRTARMLFYFVMEKAGYPLMAYASISRVIKKAPGQYMQAYLESETDGGDLTYFIIHQLKAIKESVKDLKLYLDVKASNQVEIIEMLKNAGIDGKFNFRQVQLLEHARNNPGQEYTIQGHQASHGITHQTARSDLNGVSEKYKILTKTKDKRSHIFIAPANIELSISLISRP
ncbi:MAG: Fic family protein [Bermanella sp.]